ncbi:alcohol dehydrogenase catalytic domain-containing protein [Parahaliea mediterranea]|uniref:NADH oxidase n=1 Tax=Parahaliea mediterranea TaxID=651086 RepID=A0A939IMY1_9GAMM|nr:NADH oxidase [Parahaliea mediterranea]MBN7797508.1 NADH oxidase [Parahaliea mediterranea]
MNSSKNGLVLNSTATSEHTIELTLDSAPIPVPKDDEVVVRVEATPINPSDLALLLAFADVSQGITSGSGAATRFSAPLTAESDSAIANRLGVPQRCGNEGAGTVISAGSGQAAQALLGKKVAVMDGALYCQYRKLQASQCVPLEDSTTPQQAAACFVNPMTALGMVEQARRKNCTAIVHTAAASSLGLMLNRLCLVENIDLVNIVRRPSQAEQLRSEGARYVVDSSSDTFKEDLVEAITQTNAYMAFDAVGGGSYINDILGCMEAAARRTHTPNGPYGTNVHKQVYVYGRLDTQPFMVDLGVGFSWSVEGFLLPALLAELKPERVAQLRRRAVSEVKTTFRSRFAKEISLAQALQQENIIEYSKAGTGAKYLINPSLDVK